MKTMEIAKKLVQLCRDGKSLDAYNTLFSENAVSVEAGAPGGMDREAKGLAAIRAKSDWWTANHEVHSVVITGPWPHDDKFIVGFQHDITQKESGNRIQMDEVGLYYVRDDKIIREEFFYDMGS